MVFRRPYVIPPMASLPVERKSTPFLYLNDNFRRSLVLVPYACLVTQQ
jgi:hypothetical protein